MSHYQSSVAFSGYEEAAHSGVYGSYGSNGSTASGSYSHASASGVEDHESRHVSKSFASGASRHSSNGQHQSGHYSSSSKSRAAQSPSVERRSSSRAQSSAGNNGEVVGYSSKFEAELRRAKKPIEVNSSERKSVLNQSGIWLNKQEEESWRGKLSLSQYEINDDSNPEVIRKRPEEKIVYNQKVEFRCLRPPQLPPAEIVIKEVNPNSEEAPPVIIRQVPERPRSPGQNVVREQPPQAPKLVENKVIKVPGKPAPPPKRRVIIEKLPNIPEKPESILVEKWTGYGPQKINVRYERAGCLAEKKVRNLIIEWEGAEAEVKKECKSLGCQEADPEEYLRKYGSEIGRGNADSALDGCCFEGCDSICNKSDEGKFVLEGDVDALSLVDLDREGLGFLREFVKGGRSSGNQSSSSSGSRRRSSQENREPSRSERRSSNSGRSCQKPKRTCGN